MTAAAKAISAIPDHVPADLVFDFNPYADPAFRTDPFGAMIDIRNRAPSIFYSPELGGFWCVTSYEDVREVMRDASIFSSAIAGIPDKQRPVKLKPLQLDPPEHGDYRKLLAPLFTPAAMAAWEPRIRTIAKELIGKFKERGHCEFIAEFCAQLPNQVFALLMGLPLDELDQLLEWEKSMVRGANQAEMDAAGVNVLRYIDNHFERRRGQPRQEDLTDHLLQQNLSNDDLRSVGFLLYIAGLDTVQSMLGFIFLRLGYDQDLQQALRDDPAKHSVALEEMLRVNPVVNINRTLSSDYSLHGINMLKGERIMCPAGFANVDAAMFPGGAAFDPGREFNPHLTFGAGQHRCLGSHLARREIAIALEEMGLALPAYRVDSSKPLVTGGGSVFHVEELQLIW